MRCIVTLRVRDNGFFAQYNHSFDRVSQARQYEENVRKAVGSSAELVFEIKKYQKIWVKKNMRNISEE